MKVQQPKYGDLLTALYNRLTILTEGIGHIEEKFVLLLKKSEQIKEVSTKC